MSSAIDPAKLKVVELRAELTQRGLDSKGNKPALVKRLKEALEEELLEEIPDTSIADTSTEDLDSSQTQPSAAEESKLLDTEEEQPEKCSLPPKSDDVQNIVDDDMEGDSAQQGEEAAEPKEQQAPESEQDDVVENDNEKDPENGEQDEPKSRKSRWGGDSESADAESKDASEVPEDSVKSETEEAKVEGEAEQKGEKRKHSPSPERSQRRRSKSPIKEDEPPIDNDKVQLSWYDSDLHLQVDKESFLSAKPYYEGAFGFAWAGVRATHGVSSGKVCFEVKITEELKWEDFSKHEKQHHRRDRKHEHDHQRKSEEKPKSDKQEQTENGEKTEQENMETDGADKTEQVTEEPKPDDNKEAGESEQQPEEKEETPADETSKMETEEEKEEKAPEEANKDEPAQEQLEAAQEQPEGTEPAQEQPEATESAQEQPEATEPAPEPELAAEPLPTHLFRVGWSILDSGLQLGENKFSYGYESSGKFVTEKQFQDYGVKFAVGDVIGNFLSIDEDGFTITYSVNGEVQPEAITVTSSDLPENFALFPHVLSRNYAFELNLGSKEEAWFEKPADFIDYEYLENIEDKVTGPVRPETRSECEVILMCGLPASGKTHWVREYVASNPDKKYTLIGNAHFLEKMTIYGDALKSKYKGSWNILLDKLQRSLNKLADTAAQRRRNYIIDQTNVFPSAQRRKMRPFEGFKRRAVVVVVGDEEQAKRQSLQEAQDGKDVPDSAVFEMKANMSLPQKGDWLDEVTFAELGEEEAKAMVQKYNTQAKEAGYGIQRRFGHRDDRHRWQNRPGNDYRGGSYRDRSYQRYDRGPPRQNWHPQRPGGWNRDRRDNRGPAMGGNRDWRNNRDSGSRDRQNRDHQGGGSNYNRNRNQVSRPSGGNWQSGGWGGQGQWNNQAWNQQGTWGQGGWGGQQTNQNQWKYGGGGGGGQGYGGYGNWNYYNQYAQNNWNAQGQTQATGANAYGQYSQQEWAQYAQQYAQQGQNTSGAATTQSALQK